MALNRVDTFLTVAAKAQSSAARVRLFDVRLPHKQHAKLVAHPPAYLRHMRVRAALAHAPRLPSPLAQSSCSERFLRDTLARAEKLLFGPPEDAVRAAPLLLEAWLLADRREMYTQLTDRLAQTPKTSFAHIGRIALQIAVIAENEDRAQVALRMARVADPSLVAVMRHALYEAKTQPRYALCYFHLSPFFELKFGATKKKGAACLLKTGRKAGPEAVSC